MDPQRNAQPASYMGILLLTNDAAPSLQALLHGARFN
jgi:hypothetical protein